MSVQESTIIDFISFDEKKNVILTISDHLDWSEEHEHLVLLQEKVNTYCKYIENGQIYDEYPDARDKRPLISVVLFHELTPKAEVFFQKVKASLEGEGFDFEWKKYRGSTL
jgi:hypothetical protein